MKLSDTKLITYILSLFIYYKNIALEAGEMTQHFRALDGGPGSNSQHPQGNTLILHYSSRESNALSGLRVHSWYTNIYRQNIHTHKIKADKSKNYSSLVTNLSPKTLLKHLLVIYVYDILVT